jgi:beta-1,4-mannosyl-glycoprotein beta-1,4-N-acetylglucosaminyltransferase
VAEVIDAVLYFNEIELFCARYDLLKGVVDRFCVFEAGCTFTGQPKANDFWSDLERIGFDVDKRRVSYLLVPELPDQASAQSDPSLSTECQHVARIGFDVGNQWFKEHLSRELMKRTFVDASDDTVVLVSDVDEIPTPEAVHRAIELIGQHPQVIVSIPMRDFVGSVACDTGKNWEGTFAMTKHLAVQTTLSMVRTLDASTGRRTYPGTVLSSPGGWHFSSFGGRDTVERKIRAWGHQELNRWDIRWFLGANLALGRDIFGRDLRWWQRGALIEGDGLNPCKRFDLSKSYHGFICGHANASLKDRLLRGCFVVVQIVRRVLARAGWQ